MDNQTVRVAMTTEEQAEFAAFKAEQARKRLAEEKKAEREAYRQLAEQTVEEMMPCIIDLNRQMRIVKERVYNAFSTLITTKGELFGTKDGQRSHSFINADATKRIILGYHKRDAWADTVSDGIGMVKAFISAQGVHGDNAWLVSAVLELLGEDAQGNLKADKVLQLDKYASESGDEGFILGVQIIKEAYRPEMTKQFIRAEVKDAQNKWVVVPLTITELENVLTNLEE